VGGSLKSFKLKQYADQDGAPLELIDAEVGISTGWPLALLSGDKDIDEKLRNALFVAKPETNKVTLEFAAGGIYARKALQFNLESHEFTLETQLANEGKAVPHSVVWQGSFGDQSKDAAGVPLARDPAKKHALYQTDAAFTRIALTSLTKEPQTFSSLRAGVEDQYFVAMFRSMSAPLTVKIANQEYPGADAKPAPSLHVSVTRTQDEPMLVYVGPKQQDWLGKADPQLAAIQDFGLFEFIAKPLLQGLLWVNRYIGNYGWAIVVLTLALNLAIFPLKLKQQFAMLKMQKIQPQMRRLQDQYKKLKASDPRRPQVQSEMMGLYKQHGVNPMGGCFPLLLQMPFFFGFYSALAYAIELRRAPWILWIKDLSQYDPSYMLPILVAVAMIVQQKLTPMANLDPAQARMMMLMPVVMTFMFLSVSSGLALYWLTGSVVGIGQQLFMNKYWSPKAEAKIGARTPKEPRGA
jgi:YidC/Oxa1 family membrane protein insertase